MPIIPLILESGFINSKDQSAITQTQLNLHCRHIDYLLKLYEKPLFIQFKRIDYFPVLLHIDDRPAVLLSLIQPLVQSSNV